MNLGDYTTIKHSRNGRVLTLTLNRPDALNAINGTMHEELATAFVDANDDPDSDVVVVTGAGRAFSTGGDLDWMQEAIDQPSKFETLRREGIRIINSLLDCEKPVVAKVNGHAAGLGASIALFCDVVIASNEAKIGDPHVRVGFTAGDGGVVIRPQLIGYARAKHYLMTGDLIPAPEAAAIGLIYQSVPAKKLDEVVDAYAERLAKSALYAVRTTKMAVNAGLRQLANSVLELSFSFEDLSNRTADHREAVAAFRDRRSPSFVGR